MVRVRLGCLLSKDLDEMRTASVLLLLRLRKLEENQDPYFVTSHLCLRHNLICSQSSSWGFGSSVWQRWWLWCLVRMFNFRVSRSDLSGWESDLPAHH